MIVGVQPLAGFDKLLHYTVPETLRGAVRARNAQAAAEWHAPVIGLDAGVVVSSCCMVVVVIVIVQK